MSLNNINFSLSQRLGLALRDRQLLLAVAESCTGGGLANEITAVAGSSAWFDRGFVTYSNESKMELLGVKAETLAHFGAVSEQAAAEMVCGVIAHSRADLAISITGIAGPSGGTTEKPVGYVCFGLMQRDEQYQTRVAHFTSGRKYIRRCAVGYALQWLLETIGIQVKV